MPFQAPVRPARPSAAPQSAAPQSAKPFMMNGTVRPTTLPKDDGIDDTLQEAFGYSRGPETEATRAGDVSARAGLASRAYQPMLEDPGDARRAAGRTPTRDESANEDAYVGAQAAKFGHDADRIEAAHAADIKGREIASREFERDQREAVRTQLIAQFGTDDPKIVQAIMEMDKKNSLSEGFQNDISKYTADEKAETAKAQAALETAQNLIAQGDTSAMTKLLEARAKQELEQARAKYNRNHQLRLAKFTAQLGQNVPGQAYAQQKPVQAPANPFGTP